MNEETTERLKRKLSAYRYCLEEWRNHRDELGSALVYRDQGKALLDLTPTYDADRAALQERWQELNAQLERSRADRPQAYKAHLKRELSTELRIIEADLHLLPRLIYEEALRTWVAVEAAGHLLAELERIAGSSAQVEADRARYESLWRELEARVAALPEEAEARQSRPADLPAPPPPALTLPDVLASVRRWTPAERRVLRQELEREHLYETVGPEAGQRVTAEEREDYSPEESEAQTEDSEEPCA